MIEKSRFSVGIMDIHDVEKKDAFIAYRKRTTEDYEERYRDLPKLFFSRSFFEQMAEEHGMDICFPKYDMPGYWNSEYIFHCFLYRR